MRFYSKGKRENHALSHYIFDYTLVRPDNVIMYPTIYNPSYNYILLLITILASFKREFFVLLISTESKQFIQLYVHN